MSTYVKVDTWSECVIDVVPNLLGGQKRDGRCVYDRRAKQELVRRCQQPGVSVAPVLLPVGIALRRSREGDGERWPA